MTRLETNIVLLFSVLCASVSLMFECSVASQIPGSLYLALVCGMAFPLVALAGFRHFKNLTSSVIWKSALLATLLVGKILNEWGDCTYLDAAVVSAYDSLQVLLVPLLLLLIGRKPKRDQLIGAAIIIVGIMLMRGAFWVPVADYADYTLFLLNPALSTCFTSALIVAIMLVVKDEDPVLVTVFQLAFAALIGIIWSIFEGSVGALSSISSEALGQLFTVAFFGMGLMYYMNNIAQRYADAMNVAIITALAPFMLVVMTGFLPPIHFETVAITPFSVFGSSIVVLGALLSGTMVLSKITKDNHKKELAEDCSDSASESASEHSKQIFSNTSNQSLEPLSEKIFANSSEHSFEQLPGPSSPEAPLERSSSE